jgi:quercetin dioxygenase-like cupin family protein
MRKLLCSICFISVFANYALAAETDIVAITQETVNVETLAKTSTSWNGQLLPYYLQGRPEITILRITIPPGTQLPLHKHPVINAGVLLEGELTVITEDNDILHLEAGEAIIEVVNKWHYGINEGETPAKIIAFYAGVEDIPVTVDYSQ